MCATLSLQERRHVSNSCNSCQTLFWWRRPRNSQVVVFDKEVVSNFIIRAHLCGLGALAMSLRYMLDVPFVRRRFVGVAGAQRRYRTAGFDATDIRSSCPRSSRTVACPAASAMCSSALCSSLLGADFAKRSRSSASSSNNAMQVPSS